SLINQSLEEIEILIFDDCSTDNSVEIIEEYLKKSNKLVFVKNETNLLPGVIRNTGVQKARGKYIMFVDSDDWIDSEACEILYHVAEKNSLDILVGKYIESYGDQKKIVTSNLNTNPSVFDGYTFIENNEFTSHAWNKLWLRDFIVKNDLKNEEGRYYQDVSMTLDAFLIAKRVASINYCYYFYYLSGHTSVTRMPSTDKHLKDRMWVISYYLEKMQDYNGTGIFRPIQMKLAKNLHAGLSSLRKYKGDNKELSEEFLSIISKALRKTGLAILRARRTPILKRILIYLSPSVYLRIYGTYDWLKR
ncbi:MAG: glycosyltransferase, partial [Bacteroidetes bacterium]|nr:glycosyltransferase [Bacteroidota bacterium]